MKKAFMTGLAILIPLATTLWVLVFVLDLFTNPFLAIVHPLVGLFHIQDPGLITFLTRVFVIVILFLIILLLGAVGQWFLITKFFHFTHLLFSRIPIVKTIYKVSKEIVKAVVSPGGIKPFQQPAIVSFPEKHHYSMGIISGKIPKECEKKLGKRLVPIFVPTAPHPITGYMFLATEEAYKKVDMSNEEAIKLVVSCGIIVPEEKK